MTEGRLAGKVAVITGAGSGIGRATAIRFAAEGATVVVNDRDAGGAAETVRMVGANGGVASADAGDVTDSSYVDALVNAAVVRHGRLDVMHNNAGYGLMGSIGELTDDDLDEVLRINVCAVAYGCRAAVNVMKERGGGSIINTASNAAFGATPGRASSYGAAKAAALHLTKSTAAEYGRHGIRANAICPGPIATAAFLGRFPDTSAYAAKVPLQRLGTPEDIAAVAVFLASDESSFVSGIAIPVDGGLMACLPGGLVAEEVLA